MPRPIVKTATSIAQAAGFKILSYLHLRDLPTLGTAAALNVPTSAGASASSSQVVRGDDPRLGAASPYVFSGTWAGLLSGAAASGQANGAKAKVTDVAAGGATCDFEVRTMGGTKYWVPCSEVTLAADSGAITGSSGVATSLATPLQSGAGATGTFLALTGVLKAGLLTPPNLRLRVEAYLRKQNANGSVRYVCTYGATVFGLVQSGSSDDQDVRLFAELVTTTGLAYASGTLQPQSNAGGVAAPLALSNGSAQDVGLGWTAGNASDTQELYAYRVTLRA